MTSPQVIPSMIIYQAMRSHATRPLNKRHLSHKALHLVFYAPPTTGGRERERVCSSFMPRFMLRTVRAHQAARNCAFSLSRRLLFAAANRWKNPYRLLAYHAALVAKRDCIKIFYADARLCFFFFSSDFRALTVRFFLWVFCQLKGSLELSSVSFESYFS